MKSLLVIGGGPHGRDIAETATLLGFQVLGFADDNPAKNRQPLARWKVIGKWHDLKADDYVVAIGNNQQWEFIFAELQRDGRSLPTLVHPFSCVSPGAQLGAGFLEVTITF